MASKGPQLPKVPIHALAQEGMPAVLCALERARSVAARVRTAARMVVDVAVVE